MPRIDRDRAELNRVEKCEQVSADDAEVRRSALVSMVSTRHSADVTGVLLVEALAVDAVGESLQNERPVRMTEGRTARRSRSSASDRPW